MVTFGPAINTNQDIFWANTIVFMDKLQPLPVISNNSGTLSLNTTYNAYQWFENGVPVSNDSTFEVNDCEMIYVEATLNGGCVVRSKYHSY